VKQPFPDLEPIASSEVNSKVLPGWRCPSVERC